jgi:cytochrome c oxidase subunit 3
MTTAARPAVDVSDLPTTVFGHRSPMWWGTIGFMIIEGSTLIICAVAYFYLRRNFESYPPPDTLPPSLTVPTIGVVLLMLTNIPMFLADRAARNLDLVRLRRWSVFCCVISLAFFVIRPLCFSALNVRWDTNAYGSAIWFIVGFHTVILLFEIVETMIFTSFLFRDPVESQMYSAASDNALYWYFMTLSWLPLYAIVYLLPHMRTW